MINETTLARLENYTFRVEDYPRLKGASEALSHHLEREVEVIGGLGYSGFEIVIRIKTQLVNTKNENPRTCVLFLSYKQGKGVGIETPNPQLSDNMSVTLEYMASLLVEYANILSKREIIEGIININLPSMEKQQRLFNLTKRVREVYYVTQAALKNFGPINTLEEREELAKKLDKLPLDEWPNELVEYGEIKINNRSRVMDRIDEVDVLIQEIDEIENEALEYFSEKKPK